MKNYDISVIIPVYNVQEYLNKCVDSVLQQKGVNFEIIIVDDGSTDESGRICDEYSEIYENITVIHKVNQGLGYARNTGLDIAQGNYIFFLDSDDWIVENALRDLYELAIDNNAEVVCFELICVSDRNYIFAERKEINVERVDNYELMKKYISGMSATACSKLYKKDIFSHVRFTNVPIHEDAYSMHLFLGRVRKAVITNQIFYIQYVRLGSLTQSIFEEKNMLCIECGNRLIEFAKSKYPDLIIYARFNKIKRQLYSIDVLLRGPLLGKIRKYYLLILQDMKEEIYNVKGNVDINKCVYDNALRIVMHPYIYLFRVKSQIILSKFIKGIYYLCGKNLH